MTGPIARRKIAPPEYNSHVSFLRRAGVLFLLASGGFAQPAFDVASLKFTTHGRNADGWSFSDLKMASPGRLEGTNSSLQECLEWAYQLKRYQIVGPDWMNADDASYDIEAKAPTGTSRAEVRLMLQRLLAERLQVKVHRESRMLPVYELVVSRKGPKLSPPKETKDTGFWSEGSHDSVRIHSERATLTDLANRLSLDLERPVFDRTGLDGQFAIQLRWARGDGDGQSVFGAIEQELGLKLQPAKAPIEVLVVDHAEKTPVGN